MSIVDLQALAATAERLAEANEPKATAWPDPTELTAELPQPPEFDAKSLLPEPLRGFVLDEAVRMPCSPDYVAVALITALGSLIGGRCAIKPKKRDDWIVTPNLFGGVVGDPSSKKSPAIGSALRFIDGLEAREAARYAQQQKEHKAELVAFEAKKSALQSAMKKAASAKGDRLIVDSAAADLQAMIPPEEPRLRRFKTNDGTVAKIGEILAGNPAGLLVVRDELVGLLASWEREGNEGDRSFYLEAFNGTGSFSIDRIGRGSQHVSNLCLSVFGGIQPELLQRYLATMVNSLDNDGRMQRFQMLVYPDPVAWQWRDDAPDRQSRDRVRSLFERLAAFDPLEAGAKPQDEFVKLPWFSFDDAAQELFIQWMTELNTSRIKAEQEPLMRQHLAKFDRLFCALALILHLAEGRTGLILEDTALRAAAWCQYLEGHARRIYALVEVEPVTLARALGHLLMRRKLRPDGFTVREVLRLSRAAFKTPLQVESALAVLEEHGWVISVESAHLVGRPTVRYYVNPLIYGVPA